MIEDGFSGEVLVRGPSLMSGYLGDTCATEDAFVDGWLKTGDVAFVKGGKWYIVGRSKVTFHFSLFVQTLQVTTLTLR